MDPHAIPVYDSGNVVELRTTQLRPFKNLFDALKENIDDISIYFNSQGMQIYTMDRSQSASIEVSLEADKFDHFYCLHRTDEEGNELGTRIDISVPNVNKVLKTITNDDDLLIWTFNPQHEYLCIYITNNTKLEQSCYRIKLQNPNNVDPTVMEGLDKYSCVLTMPTSDYNQIAKRFKSMNAIYVTIEYSRNHEGEPTLSFSSNTDVAEFSTSRNASTSDENPNSVVFSRIPEGSSCYCDRFSFSHLYNFTKCANIGSKNGGQIVRVYLNEEQPAVLIFNIGSLGEIKISVAPITEEEI